MRNQCAVMLGSCGLSYLVKYADDLSIQESWTSEGVTHVDTSSLDLDYDLVTVAIPKGKTGFVRLEVEMDTD